MRVQTSEAMSIVSIASIFLKMDSLGIDVRFEYSNLNIVSKIYCNHIDCVLYRSHIRSFSVK
jgi:hypothetical protein